MPNKEIFVGYTFFCSEKVKQYTAIENRLKKQEKNRQTTTYIKFSYGKRTWYLGFYIPCSFCSNVCAYVMSNNRKKKEAAFECEDIKVAEQLTSAGKNTTIDNITTNFQELEIREQDIMLSWQEILCKEIPITRPEFHRGLNSIRDLKILMTYCDGVRNKRLAYKMTYAYVIGQCAIRARKIKSDS
ncbi:hypothetical protein RhiirC2_716269 [Rhizophagus irregularis]|uniref:Uncharacterized protein n=1 Tax=Rhizophagus irregularis TaxID=588596 RepID=A0A2N1MS49_9GLOM|nr:hypothetical protein RhiirC2_716269 [Rhizophagus irregularis]